MAILEAKVGAQTAAAGAYTVARATRNGGLGTADVAGRYQEAVREANVFIGANPAGTAVTTQAGLSATTPALTLYNPSNSGYNLVLLGCGYIVTAAPAAAAGFMLAYNALNATAPATVTAVTPANAILGNTTVGVGLCYRIATLAAAPVAFCYLGGTTGAAAIGGYQTFHDLGGLFIVPPSVAISIQATSAAAILAEFIWQEIPV